MLSPNSNMCASCSTMADGLDKSNPTECGDAVPGQRMTRETGAENRRWPGALASTLQ